MDVKVIKELLVFATKISEKGAIALIAVAFCAYLAWDLREVQKEMVKQGKAIQKVEDQVKQLRDEVDNLWGFYNEGQKKEISYASKMALIEEQIRELQRKH